MDVNKRIPQSVVERMTKYLMCTQELAGSGVEWVSSVELAQTLDLTSSTVRQDLSHLDFSGTSKRGYATVGLQNVLSHALGADTEWPTVVVGAGNLGKALALHEEFARRGFKIRGIFDSDSKKVGRKIGHLRIQPMVEMAKTIAVSKVGIGVIAVPALAAQSAADLLIAAGVDGLLNLSVTHLVVPRRVKVVDVRVAARLLELSHAIRVERSGQPR